MSNVLDEVNIVPEQYMGFECDDLSAEFPCGWGTQSLDCPVDWHKQLIEKTLSCPDCGTPEHLKFWYVDDNEWEGNDLELWLKGSA